MTIRTTVQSHTDRDIAILRIIGDLDFDDRGDFINGMNELLEAPESRLLVDLSTITRMSSVYIGTIVDYSFRAKEANKELAIRILPRMGRVCLETGLEKAVKVIIAQG